VPDDIIDEPLSPCEAAADLADQIAEAMAAPKRVKGDQGEIENHSITDLIKADQYLASKCAADKPHRGLRLTKLIPGGTA
jgi:hypothetical protein